jgi:hypothetical protein
VKPDGFRVSAVMDLLQTLRGKVQCFIPGDALPPAIASLTGHVIRPGANHAEEGTCLHEITRQFIKPNFERFDLAPEDRACGDGLNPMGRAVPSRALTQALPPPDAQQRGRHVPFAQASCMAFENPPGVCRTPSL